MQSEVTLKPLTTDKVNELLDNLEINHADDEQIKINLALESLNQEISTILLSRKLKGDDVSEFYEMQEAMKFNISALQTLIQEINNA